MTAAKPPARQRAVGALASDFAAASYTTTWDTI
jgi:hypothetical protein